MNRTISRRHFALLLGGIPFVTAAANRATKNGVLGQRQVEAVERVLRRLVDGNVVPGIIYSIGNLSETLAEGAFGLRVVEPPARMEIVTRCALASVSKQFAAAAVFVLQQQGALSLDEPLSKYLPDYRYAREMTLQQVLTMRSGVPANDEACEAPINGEIDSSTLLANLDRHKLDFSPGRYFAYSNCGYDVVGAVVARASNMSYSQFIDEHFFKPLGMASSYALGRRDDSNFAQGFAPKGQGWKVESATAADSAFASGNLVSTVGDMQRWNRSLLDATVLTRQSLRRMFTVPTVGGTAHTHYAYGWFVEPSGVIWHGGTLTGYGTVNMLIPASGHAITLLSNTAPSERWKPGDVARDVYNAASLGPTLPPLVPRVRTTAPH